MTLKIALFFGFATGIYYLVATAITAHNSWQEQQDERHNEEVAKRAAAQNAVEVRARELEAIEEKKRKDLEFEEFQKKRHLEKYGPRN